MDGEVVGRLELLGAVACHRLGGVADLAGDLVLDHLGGAHMLPELGLIGQRFRFRPGGLELLRAADRVPFVGGDDAEEIALAHHLDDAGMFLTSASSTLSSLAPIAGGRTTRPCSMPGTRKSCM